MEQNPYADVNYRKTMSFFSIFFTYNHIFWCLFSLWKCEMTMERKTVTRGCVSWGVLVRQKGIWTPNCKVLLGILWNLKYYSFHLYSLQAFISLSSFLSLHLTFATFRCVLISTVLSCLSFSILMAPVHCRLSSPGVNPHLPLHLQLLPSRKQDTQMAERPPSRKERGLKIRFREQKAQRKPLPQAAWDPWHRTALYNTTVLLHCNKAKKVCWLLLLRNTFLSEHVIGLPMIEGVRWETKVIPSRWNVLCCVSHIISTRGFAVWDFIAAKTKLQVSLLF